MPKILSAIMLTAAFLCQFVYGTTLVSMVPDTGLAINTPFCELSIASRIIAIEPPWANCYFSSGIAKVDFIGDEKKIEMKQREEKNFKLNKFSATVNEDDSVTIDLSGVLTQNVNAIMEYTVMAIPGYVLANSDYSGVDMNGKEFSGHIDTASSNEMYNYGTNFKKITIKSQLGVLNIEVLEGPGLNMIDRRGNTFMNFSCYWIGTHAIKLSMDSPSVSKVKVSFDVAENLHIAEPLIAMDDSSVSLIPDAEIVRPQSTPILPVLPVPEKLEYTGGVYSPSSGVLNLTEAKFSEHDNARLERAYNRLINGAAVVILADAAIPDEGYRLSIGKDGMVITASSARGAFYAMQTAKLLGQEGSYKCAEVVDSPDMPLRSVHLCLDSADRTYFNLIEDVLAPVKINTIVGEVEYVKWDATKEMGIHQPAGMSKAELAEFVQLCDDNFIEFIPLMQTLGHCGWLFKNGKNLDMAEDPNTPYAYDVSNPAVYPLMSAILDEIFEICNPRYLHIGHDEVTMVGRFPNRPENVAKGIKQIVFDDVMFYYNYAKQRDCRIMMWHDMIMAPGESLVSFGGAPNYLHTIRKDLPRDVIICVWRYTGNSFPEFKILKDEGFDAIGCSWFSKNNPEQLAENIVKDGGLGVMVTTWAGYFGSSTLLQENFYQVEPYVRGGNWFWRTSRELNSKYDYSRILNDMLYKKPSENVLKSGVMVDFSNAANLLLTKDFAPFMLCPNLDLDKFPKESYFGNVKFSIPQRDGKNSAIAFKSRLNPEFPEDEITLKVNTKAKEVFVLSTTTGLTPPPKTLMGKVILEYADDTEYEFDVIYGFSVGTPGDDFSYNLKPYDSYSWNFDNAELNIWNFGFANPNPDKVISAISLKGSPEGFGYYILGISLVQ